MVVQTAIEDAEVIKAGNSAVTFILWLFFARFVHRAALFNVKFGAPNPDGSPDRFFGGFIFKGLTLLVASFILVAPFAFYIFFQAEPPATPTLRQLLPFILPSMISYATLLSLAGSWLPASVYRRNTGLGAALKRGSRNFFKVFCWIAPTLLLGAAIELALIGGSAVVGIDASVIRNASFNPGGALITFVVALVETVNVSLIAVVLSHFYLAAEGVAEPVLQN